MAESQIPVDLFNPGQVMACLGLLEAAEILIGGAEGGFDWSDGMTARFRLRAAGPTDPVREILRFLAEAEVVALIPQGPAFDASAWTEKQEAFPLEQWKAHWELEVEFVSHEMLPFGIPDRSDVLPALLRTKQACLTVDHWGDRTRRDAFKLWAGGGGIKGVKGGKPGARILRDCLEAARGPLQEKLDAIAADPFAFATPLSSGFRVDWRRDYIPLEIGFSPNEHSSMTMRGHPLVEVLAVIGLQHARPERLERLAYRYGVADGLLPPLLARAAFGAAELPLPMRRFRMRLGWPGQEGQARCIVDVVEENWR
ncbi:MAG: type I-U CRISPR-associated protein Cas8c [Rhodovarius sp.]|nr:type I-U CRISPR-associated protein Cas8c [Rhodovarius sp.]